MTQNGVYQNGNPRKRTRDTSPYRPVAERDPPSSRAQATTALPALLQRLSSAQPHAVTLEADDVTYAERLPRELLDTTLGRVFNRSFVDIGDGARFQAAVQVRTGEEPEHYLDPEDSLSASVGRLLNRAALSIVNQPTGVIPSAFAEDEAVALGQVVLLKTERALFIGLTCVYDGPYILVAQSGGKGALINEEGRFHPVLVPLSSLRPYYSSWHVYALPTAVAEHPALLQLLGTAQDPQPSADR
jgi:hypothetical protein